MQDWKMTEHFAKLYFALNCIASTMTQLLFHCQSGCVVVGLPGALCMQFTVSVYTVHD